MPNVLSAALTALFADPNIGRDAGYIADGCAPVLVRAVVRHADAVKLPKRLDLVRDAERAHDAVPGLIVARWAESRAG